MNVTPASMAALFYSFDARFQRAYQAAPIFYNRIATEIPSTTAETRYWWTDQVPRMREWVGERLARNIATRSTSILNKDWELTVELDRNRVKDDQLQSFQVGLDSMGRQARKWPDDLVAQLLQAGVSTTCYDGQNFFDTSHPVNIDDTSLSTYSNKLTTTPLNAANFAAARAQMAAYNGPDGRPLGVNGNLLVVPPALELQARQILQAEMIAPSGAFGINGAGGFQTNILRNSADLLVVPELNNEPTVWYLVDTTKGLMPIIFQLREAPKFVALTAPEATNVFWKKKFIYGAESRGNAGFGIPFLMLRAIA